jgi:aspartate carbamoyltransferase catalytic subunit
MKHLININDISKNDIKDIFSLSDTYNLNSSTNSLKNKLIVMLFFENSTRTKSSFEIAAKRLGANTLSLSQNTSARAKGESIKDTIKTLDAMKPNAIVIRHSAKDLPLDIEKDLKTPILNAGSGDNSHPTQALLDLYTIIKHFGGYKNIKGKKIAIVGDIKNSRVASSNLELLPKFGLIPILVAPKCFMPNDNKFSKFEKKEFLSEVIDDIDIVMSLRTQLERHSLKHFSSLEEFGKQYCITKDALCSKGKDKNILLLHPGPVNINVDISEDLMNDKRCKVLEQVSNGVKIKMAIYEKMFAENDK